MEANMNKTKLFNYSIQLMETERNMKMMNKLIPMLDSYKSKLILYNYDSLLFDFCMDDKLDFLRSIKNEIEENPALERGVEDLDTNNELDNKILVKITNTSYLCWSSIL